ncbi:MULTISPECIES: penicillin-binding protein 2 [unclassified Breznakia]|uniref:peptidoglycan D,D-transpeptidase FtsI family protein n=1 Tax=unclassified Breznakia TaxID=2623764 RepID=UPI0024757A09|nr:MULTISPECIES: penicillin-binding protein 2 [unclassified Breznakia]MDH6367684.1 cell division protein FtsI/penicillin-binding protein 2 [Breznakia sp. PH1-1]MDH6404772.1 cell division protein FtsI/penicillin-binding protein 2 [Breznakia sp. PF1-11]MDH6412521.1 cell division protein FtsI/penicillin-binding protein 2 [Breznakia sp. PFB1-11]MDH6414881.1 cell division protein FtsI/penicillin-binding protein 2 [Breznakia sp. PFB1-14]MDH6417192.1 cell division protein FtsI/penicillin-binding prot
MITNPFRKSDQDRRRRSSNIFAKKDDLQKVINIRARVFIVLIVAAFAIISIKLVNIQLVKQDEYAIKLEAFTMKRQAFAPPRGDIKDRNGVLLASSKKSLSIFYYPPENITAKEEWELAEKFLTDFGMSLTKTNSRGVESAAITERQLKDMHYLHEYQLHKENFNSLLTEEELTKANEGKLDNDDIYALKIERMDISGLDENTKKLYLTYMLMNQAPENEFKIIKEGVSNEQIAKLLENRSTYPGFEYRDDWERVYYDNDNPIVKSIVGSVSDQTQGLPSENMQYYLGLGYAMNQRIGISGIEKEYESFLVGTSKDYDISYDSEGIAKLDENNAGKSGYDLTLSIDVEMMKEADRLLREAINSRSSDTEYFNNMYMTVLDVNTGEVLATAGIQKNKDGEIESIPSGTYLNAERVGSTVKMATLYMGLEEGVVGPGEVIIDQPLKFQGTDPFKSYQTWGALTDRSAIAVSSNVYMATIALRMAGMQSYVPEMAMPYAEGTFEKMRTYYNMFGLGVTTGLDVPTEGVGAIGGTEEHGKIMAMSIGQYDTYTSMQLAQYVATIANGGKRVQTHFLDKVTEVNDPDTVIYKMGANILSTLKGTSVETYISRAQEGMRGCIEGIDGKAGICPQEVSDAAVGVKMAVKTGTADNDVYLESGSVNTVSNSIVAYGPYEDPEIAISCIAPNYTSNSSNLGSNVCGAPVGKIAKYYFENKK